MIASWSPRHRARPLGRRAVALDMLHTPSLPRLAVLRSRRKEQPLSDQECVSLARALLSSRLDRVYEEA